MEKGLSDFQKGDFVKLARSPFPERNGITGIVVKTIKSRNVVRFLKTGARDKYDTYDAWPSSLDKLNTKC